MTDTIHIGNASGAMNTMTRHIEEEHCDFYNMPKFRIIEEEVVHFIMQNYRLPVDPSLNDTMHMMHGRLK